MRNSAPNHKRLSSCSRARRIAKRAEFLAQRIETVAVELGADGEHEAARLMAEALIFFRNDVVTPINKAIGALPEGPQGKKANGHLSPEAVVQMRAMYASEKYSTEELAEEFAISPCNVRTIVTGGSWLNVGGPIKRTVSRKRKLTPADVLEIREAGATGECTLKELAAMYGVSDRTVGGIVRGEKWTWVGGPIRSKQEVA